jgi:hypothetical protein
VIAATARSPLVPVGGRNSRFLYGTHPGHLNCPAIDGIIAESGT